MGRVPLTSRGKTGETPQTMQWDVWATVDYHSRNCVFWQCPGWGLRAFRVHFPARRPAPPEPLFHNL